MSVPPQTILRIDELELKNFRCFGTCAFKLHPEVNIFVADNAQGKTALLDAIALALDVYVSAVAHRRTSHGIKTEDIYRSINADGKAELNKPSKFDAKGFYMGTEYAWGLSLKSNGKSARNTRRKAKHLHETIINSLGTATDQAAKVNPLLGQTLPIAAFYGTGRLWSEHKLTKGKKGYASITPGRVSAFADCLSSSSSFKTFTTWYREAARTLRDPKYKAQSINDQTPRLLSAVREAVNTVLEPTGWVSIDWEFPEVLEDGSPAGQGHMVVEHAEKGRLPLDYLSDGVRNMIALTADLAHRCVRLNPHLGENAAKQTPGVLLIDEVDMHLHPRWQQLIVGLLSNAFPAMQLIFTTHSPHVLSTVFADSIRVIHVSNGEGVIETPKYQTRGVESADILAKIMGVDPVPQVPESIALHKYRALVQADDFHAPQANAEWEKLVAHFGSEHPVLTDIETLKRLQDFKREHNIKGGPDRA